MSEINEKINSDLEFFEAVEVVDGEGYATRHEIKVQPSDIYGWESDADLSSDDIEWWSEVVVAQGHWGVMTAFGGRALEAACCKAGYEGLEDVEARIEAIDDLETVAQIQGEVWSQWVWPGTPAA